MLAGLGWFGHPLDKKRKKEKKWLYWFCLWGWFGHPQIGQSGGGWTPPSPCPPVALGGGSATSKSQTLQILFFLFRPWRGQTTSMALGAGRAIFKGKTDLAILFSYPCGRSATPDRPATPLAKMSSINTTTNQSRYMWKTRFIKSMNTDGALVMPNGITRNS